ncbi:hypothetical protein [Streptomyces microflavus]|uniref:hypothetical protein n=1 Tax=Streptomyces microflavus TaxID=1919 RepID=UPI0033B51F55
MTEDRAALLTLLHGLDDPQHREWPRDYDRRETAALFDSLVKRLEGDFACRCATEQDTQDSSEYGRVTVPAAATARGTRIVICISKFGSLALVCADNPGAFLGTEEALTAGELDPDDLCKADRALGDLGYTALPEELLESTYDGPSRLHHHVEHPTWWHRFFGTF